MSWSGSRRAFAWRAADVVHLLGGGWINDLNPEFAGVAAAASLVGCDAPGGALRAATGQGLAPGAAGTGRLGAVWRRFDVVDVRDDDSFALVDGLPAETNRGVDDAWVALTGGAAGDGPGEGPGHGTGDDPAYDGLGHGPGDARDRPIAVCLQGDLLADGPDGSPGADALADAPGAAPGPGMSRADVDRNRAAKEAIVDRLYPWPTRGIRARARLAGIRGRRRRR